jgi:hypothetical protein
MAAEVVETLPGDEVLVRADGQEEVFLGELAEHPAAFRPGPGGQPVPVASGWGMQ